MDKVVVKHSSIDRKGLFAACNITKGEIVLKWNPKVISKEQFDQLPLDEKNYVDFSAGVYLWMQSPERFMNHSCNPNTRIEGHSDVALRDITLGEEISSDYSATGQVPVSFKCNCSAENCRGWIK